MQKSTPEEIQVSMKAWMDWKDNLPESIGFEWGMPLQIVGEVFAKKIQAADSSVSGYAIMSGDKVAISEVIQSHPHLKHDGTSIEIFEMLPLNGA